MIEYALLIMLGFCIGGLIAFLLAPTLWHRAVRLTTKRLEATMPMSLSEIEADKDLLRASYAIRIRRLEAGLNNARDKSANQLVEISKLQMQITELNNQIAALSGQLEERRNAANVFESTIRKRFPELENMVGVAKAALEDRAQEIADLHAKLTRREEVLELTERAAVLQQDEIHQLREALEQRGADRTGRFKRRPSQWTLDEYRSEYDRLNVELSKMREQLIIGHERENRQISVLKTELQQLGERIMASAVADAKQTAEWRDVEREDGWRQDRPAGRSPAIPSRKGVAGPVMRAQPWPGNAARDAASDATRTAQTNTAGAGGAKEAQPSPRQTAKPVEETRTTAPGPSASPSERPLNERKPEESSVAGASRETGSQQPGQEALKTLLDRGARLAGKELFENDVTPAAGAGGGQAEKKDAMPAPQPETGDKGPVGEQAARSEPALDQVFREMLHGRPATQDGAFSTATQGDGKQSAARQETPSDQEQAANGSADAATSSNAEPNKTQTLLDRLRVMHERQTG